MKKIIKVLVSIVIILTIIYNATLLYVNNHINERLSHIDVINDCHKIWSSRGIYNSKKEQNSIESFQRAINSGYIGFEVDFYYDTTLDRFVISHDRPKKGKDGKLHYSLKDGKLFTLEELFTKLGKGHYFWLDYKNLDRLDSKDSKKAIQRLETISKINDIKPRLYLEGCNPFKLSYYEKKGFKTLLSFHPLPKSSPFTSLSSNFFKIVYYFGNSTAIAMQYGSKKNPKYNDITQQNLKGIPQFLFHVPIDEKLINKLTDMQDVRALLVGRDKSVDVASLNKCP